MYKTTDYKFVMKNSDGNTIIFKINDAATINDLCEQFTLFLRACSFQFDGEVGIVQDPMEDVYDFLLDQTDTDPVSGAI